MRNKQTEKLTKEKLSKVKTKTKDLSKTNRGQKIKVEKHRKKSRKQQATNWMTKLTMMAIFVQASGDLLSK